MKNPADGILRIDFHILRHGDKVIGVDPRRTDKFYDRLDDLIVELQRRGYEFVPITEQIRVKN